MESDQTPSLSDRLRRVDWPRAASVTLVAAAILLLASSLARPLGRILLPFALAYLLSLALRPPVDFVSAHTRIPRRVTAALLVLLAVSLCGLGVYVGVRRALTELGDLLARLSVDGSDPTGGTVTQVMDWLWSLSEHLPFLRRFEERPGFESFCLWLDGAVRSSVKSAAGTVSERLSSVLVAAFGSLPAALLFAVTLLLSCCYFSADDGRLARAVVSRLPAPLRERLPRLRAQLGGFARKWLRAYLLLMLITFLEIFAGLSLLRVRYAFLIALLVAVVDFLPVLGSGTILVPWAIFCLLSGSVRRGLGLAVLWGVSVIVHEVCEPRLLGRSLGIHPLLSLFAMYAGLKLLGIPGMILAPLLAAAVPQMRGERGEGGEKEEGRA